MAINKDPGDSRTPVFETLDFDPDISQGEPIDWPFVPLSGNQHGGVLISRLLNKGQYNFGIIGDEIGGFDNAKIACVGDSITSGIATPSYPTYLATLVGGAHIVYSFGHSAKAMVKTFDTHPVGGQIMSYRLTTEWTNSIAWNPDIVIIGLGTVDANNWYRVQTDVGHSRFGHWVFQDFLGDTSTMIQGYQDIGAVVFIRTCPPSNLVSLPNSIIQIVNNQLSVVAAIRNCEVIDCYTGFLSHSPSDPIPWFIVGDVIHLNALGNDFMADQIYAAILPTINAAIDKGNKVLRPGINIERLQLDDRVYVDGEYGAKITENSSALTDTALFNINH